MLAPAMQPDFVREPPEDFIRIWSNPKCWTKDKSCTAGDPADQPKEKDDVVILTSWNMKLDVETPKLGFLYINGTVFVDTTKNTKITCKNLMVRSG